MSDIETKNFYLTTMEIVAQDEELVSTIQEDILYVSNLVNEAFEFTGVLMHPLIMDTSWDDRLIITYTTEVVDSDENDEHRIRVVFEKALEIGNLAFRFRFIEGGAEWHG